MYGAPSVLFGALRGVVRAPAIAQVQAASTKKERLIVCLAA